MRLHPSRPRSASLAKEFLSGHSRVVTWLNRLNSTRVSMIAEHGASTFGSASAIAAVEAAIPALLDAIKVILLFAFVLLFSIVGVLSRLTVWMCFSQPGVMQANATTYSRAPLLKIANLYSSLFVSTLLRAGNGVSMLP